MLRGLSIGPVALVTFLCLLPTGALAQTEWKEVVKRSGGFADSTDGGGKAKRPSSVQGPIAFEITGKSLRFKWSTERAGRNPDFRIEIEKRIKLNNGGNRWQRVSTFGRTHNDTKGAHALESGPGTYRMSIIGHSMQFEVLVESPEKE